MDMIVVTQIPFTQLPIIQCRIIVWETVRYVLTKLLRRQLCHVAISVAGPASLSIFTCPYPVSLRLRATSVPFVDRNSSGSGSAHYFLTHSFYCNANLLTYRACLVVASIWFCLVSNFFKNRNCVGHFFRSYSHSELKLQKLILQIEFFEFYALRKLGHTVRCQLESVTSTLFHQGQPVTLWGLWFTQSLVAVSMGYVHWYRLSYFWDSPLVIYFKQTVYNSNRTHSLLLRQQLLCSQ